MLGVLLTFRWHLLNIIFRERHLYLLEAFGPVDLQQLARMNENIWNIVHFCWFDCLIAVNQTGAMAHHKPLSIILYEAFKKLHELQLQPSKEFTIQHRDQGWGAAGRASWNRPPGVELHSVLTLWSPWCWGARLLSTFQPTCHQAGMCCSKRTSNTSKSDPCINAKRRLRHLYSAGRRFHLVHELSARNSSLWGLRMIWAVEGNEEKEK